MRVRLGSHLLLCTFVAVLAQVREARADFAQCTNPLADCTATSTGCCKQTFPPVSGNNAIIIPMNRCHNPIGTSKIAPPGSGAPLANAGVGAISQISRTGNTVTVTYGSNISWSDDIVVYVSGTYDTSINGTYVTQDVTGGAGANQKFTYTTSASGNFTKNTPTAAEVTILTATKNGGWCVSSPSGVDNGMLRAYGLVYRLMQNGIPVYWVINPSKKPPALTQDQSATDQTFIQEDIDFWVLKGVASPPGPSTGLTGCTGTCTDHPVTKLTTALVTDTTYSYDAKEFPVRGGGFLIAPSDRPKFNAFWKRINDGTYNFTGYASQTKYDWASSGIDLYEVDASATIVHQNYALITTPTATAPTAITGVPIAVKIDYDPPRVACLGCNSANPSNWLGMAGLNDPADEATCVSGEFNPTDATFCIIDDDDVGQGALVNGSFSWMWMFGYNDNTPCADSNEKSVFDKIRDYQTTFPGIRNAGHSIFLDESIKVAEGCANKQLLGNVQSTGDGLSLQNTGGTEPYIVRYPNNLFMQFGDLPMNFASGTIQGWKYYDSSVSSAGYQMAGDGTSSLRRLVSKDTTGTSNTLCTAHISTTACDSYTPTSASGDVYDLAAYGRYLNDYSNGLVYYLPGNQLNNNGNYSELRLLLNSLIAMPDETYTTTPSEVEVTRSSPIVNTLGTTTYVFQGTFVRKTPTPAIPAARSTASLNRFTFPYITGHMRAVPLSAYEDGSGNAARKTFAQLDLLKLFDAEDGIPNVTLTGCTTPFTTTCRTVFTTTTKTRSGGEIAKTYVANTTANQSGELGRLMALNASTLTASERGTLIERILAGTLVSGSYVARMGGVDRSTPAVIGASPLVTETTSMATRPTMVYFGATDGMLHAVCATAGGPCDAAGRELWAYIPRTNLPFLHVNTARVDGSPHVTDLYADFTGDGNKEMRTVLLFHTGMGDMTADETVPAVYALDISDPAAPRVLWEYSVNDVGSRDSNGIDMGVGLNVVSGMVTISGVNRPVAFVQTNNGGTGGAGSVITALDMSNGSELWQYGELYGASRDSSHELAPAAGIPGGAVGIDDVGNGNITKIVYGTLYGSVYVRDADDGKPTIGSFASPTPIFEMSVDYKPIGVPPAIYKDTTGFFAAFVTGGYVDSQGTLWRGENEATRPTQMAFSVPIDQTGTSLTESSTSLGFKMNLAANESGFAQITIIGDQLFITVDSTNINGPTFGTTTSLTGGLYQFDLGTGTTVGTGPTVIASGAGSVFNSADKVYAGGGQYGERVGVTATPGGTSVDPFSSLTTLSRKLWLRTE